MPTGPFSSLDEVCVVSLRGEQRAEHTAKEIIDEALKRIVAVLMAHPEKHIVHFSVDEPDSDQIGLRIFRGAVGDDVVQYISEGFKNLPNALRIARQTLS